MADLREVTYTATVTVERSGVVVKVCDVPQDQVAGIVQHVRQSLDQAGVVSQGPPVEQVGGYNPLEVPEEDGEGYRKRVGFG